jgi:hypothetical protein
MQTEPTAQPGTFGSINKTTVFYPLKSYAYLALFDAFFLLVLILIMIVPGLLTAVAAFAVIAPNFTVSLSIRIPIAIVAFVIAIFFIFRYLMRMQYKFVLSEDGIFFEAGIYRIYSPWKNIIGIEDTKFGFSSLKGLTLNKEFQQGPTIEEGRQQGFPVFEYTKPVYAQKYPQKLVGGRSFFPWTNTFPLFRMSNKKRVKKKLVAAIRLYAPHVLSPQTN